MSEKRNPMTYARGGHPESVGNSESDVHRVVINRFVYHYCAMYQKAPGELFHIDGVAQMENRITCMDDYAKLKELVDPDWGGGITLISLSFLGMEKGL